MTRGRPVRRAAALLAVLVLLVAACSGDDDTVTADASTTDRPSTETGTETGAVTSEDHEEILAACGGLGDLHTSAGNAQTDDVAALAETLEGEADAFDAWVAEVRPQLGDTTDPLRGPVERVAAANELFRAAIATLEGVDDVEDVPVAGDMAFVAATQRLVDAGAAVNGVLETECFPNAGSTPPPRDPLATACDELRRATEEAQKRAEEATVGSVRAWVTLTRAAHDDWAAALGSRPPAGVDPEEWSAAVSETAEAADELFSRIEATVAGRADDEPAGDETIASAFSEPETQRALDRYRDAALRVNELGAGDASCFEGP